MKKQSPNGTVGKFASCCFVVDAVAFQLWFGGFCSYHDLFLGRVFLSFDWALTQRVPPFQAMLYRDDSLPAANLPAPAAPGVSPVSFVLNMGGVLRI